MDKTTKFLLIIFAMVMLNTIYIVARSFLPSMKKKRQWIFSVIALIISITSVILIFILRK